MRKPPVLAIVIPCYNEEEVLPITSGLFKAESLSHPVVPLTEKSVFFTLEPWLPWAGLALFLTFFAPVLSRFRRHI